jgi:hypothetical protein
LPMDITLMRGMDWYAINDRFDDDEIIGYEYDDGGFTAMSTDESTVEHFRRGTGVIAFVRVPAGTKFALLGGLSYTSGEQEFLFGSKFIKLEMVPTEWQAKRKERSD